MPTFDPLAAYKKSLADPEESKKYAEGWDRIFKNKKKPILKENKS